ncbi:tetratricopeptide repeat protein [Microcoleus sp. herbarium19]|uniref:tetratricopeptide repeat protein n=1 Tax=unclassified Microcoleus TaxID=2642155 RepID=UPI003B15F73A
MPSTVNTESTAVQFNQQGETYLSQGKLEEAIASCEQALKLYPNFAPAYKTLGNALQAQGRMEEARHWYAKAIEIEPNFAEVYANLGSICAQQEKWSEAIEFYQRAIAIKPNFAGVYRNLAKVFGQIGKGAEAQQCWYQAYSLEPEKVAPAEHLNLGDALFRQEKFPEAIACYDRAIKLNPNLAQAYQNLGEALKKQGKLEEATPYYRKAIELNAANARNGSEGQQTLAGATATNGAVKQQPAATAVKPPVKPAVNPTINIEDPEAYKILAEGYFAQGKMEQAISACKKALQIKPEAPLYKMLGNALQAVGKIDEAKSCYVKAIEINPNFAEAYANYGSICAQQEQWQQAVSAYEKAIALKPDFGGAFRNFAKLLAQLGKSEAAAEALYRAFAIDPKSGTAEEHENLAKTLIEQGKVNQGIDCYRRAVELNPNAGAAYHELGEILKSQEQWEAAVEAYSNAIRNNPDLSWSHNNLAESLVKLERWEESVNAYRKAIELNPDFSWSHNNLADVLLKLERWEEAVEAYSKATALNPDFSWSHNYLADALIKLERWDEAISAYQRSIELNPDHFWAHNNLAEALVNLERWDEAVVAYRRANEINPNFFWSHSKLGDVLLELERWDEAIGVYRRAAELNHDFAWTYYNMGTAFEKLERWDESIASYRRAVEIQPDLPWISQKLADALRMRSQWDLQEAMRLYKKAIQENPEDVQLYHKALEISPNDADLYVELANALVRHSWPDGAIVFYQMALQIRPGDEAISGLLDEVLKKKGVVKGAGKSGRAVNGERQLEQENVFYSKVKEITSSTPLPLENPYDRWQKQNVPTGDDLRRMSGGAKKLEAEPLCSILMPIYNPPESLLRESIESVINQVYPHWELSIADDASTRSYVKPVLEEYAAKDSRIKLVFRSEKGQISACLNSALASVTGQFLLLLDHDDLLAQEALYEVVSMLKQHPEADLIYSDEDKLDGEGKLTDPFFKPDWCPDSFLSRMYVGRLATYRCALVNEVGGFRVGYEGSHDYDLALRLTEKTNKIFHIPKILYHGRIPKNPAERMYSTKNTDEATQKALEDALQRRKEKFTSIISVPELPGTHIIRYHIADFKLVSIIIPTRNLGSFLERCLKSIFEKTTYPNYEVMVIDNGSDEAEAAAVISKWKRKEPTRFKCYELNIPFNFSRINNYAVAQAQGDYILFLNNDTEVITSDWIEAMVEQAQKPRIGAVGAKLLYPDNTIQHAGVVLGLRSIADHSHRHFDTTAPGYYGQIASANNYSAVTGACLMCRREVFEKIGGFDEQLAVAFNDVDLCLEMLRRGYRNIYLPHVVLYHYESKSRGIENTAEKQSRFMREHETMKLRWKEIIDCDPCYNINLTRTRDDYSLRVFSSIKIHVYEPKQHSKLLSVYALDAPKAGVQLNASTIYFGGWAIGKKCPVTKIELICCGQTIREIPVGLHRPDVGQVHGNSSWAENSGFWAEVELIEMPHEAELLLQVVLEDGSRAPLALVCFEELLTQNKITELP